MATLERRTLAFTLQVQSQILTSFVVPRRSRVDFESNGFCVFDCDCRKAEKASTAAND